MILTAVEDQRGGVGLDGRVGLVCAATSDLEPTIGHHGAEAVLAEP